MPTYGEATTLSGLLAITTSAAIVWRLRNYVTWQRLWPILLTFIIVSTIAIFALTRIEDHILRRILGVALILISIYFMLFSQRIKLSTTKKVQVGAGTLSGLMGGFFGMQGPPAVLYFIQSEPTKEHYMAMAQTYFLIGNVMMTGVRAYNGFFTTTVAFDYLYGLGGVIIGTMLGAYVFKHIPNRIFRYIVYAYICIKRCNHTNDKLRTMAYMNKFTQSEDYRRDELIRIIEHSVEKLTLAELEALYYDMTTKSYIND